jgi:hypothetical protein
MAVLVSNGEGSGIEGVGACGQKMKYLSIEYLVEILPNQASKMQKKIHKNMISEVLYF